MDRYRASTKKKIDLHEWDTIEDKSDQGKKNAEDEFKALNAELEKMQELLYAEHRHKVLIVLQAMDTGGKDGAIRHVFEGVNPAGVRVASFKVPTSVELDHDYLWRAHAQVPGKGEMVIFNRSHYEDVLVVRVHNLVPQEVWSRRYDQINAFEKILAEEGTTILKFYLHISKDEQRQRLMERLKDPTKHWKFSLGDLKERALWDEYQKAYEDLLEKTSTNWAPWFIVPANQKWYRDLIIARVLVDTFKKLKMKYPESTEDLSRVVID